MTPPPPSAEPESTGDPQQEAEARLMHAQRMEAMGRLAGGIAHDFNNLLTVIVGFTQMALDRVQGQPDLAADLEQVVNAGQRASLLTRQLLAFSRKQVIEPKAVNLNAVVVDLDRMLRRVIGEDVELRTVLAASLGEVRVDPGQIEQVIVNLVINARDAMPHGGSLTIETAEAVSPPETDALPGMPPGRFVRLRVRDTGSGIPPDVVGRIFEPFFTTKLPGKGTGLGLSTVYGIVTQSGGYMVVDSVVGQGTTFTIYLPVMAPRADPLPAPAAVNGHTSGGETVLVVENDASIRQLAMRTLAGCGYHILAAGSSADALATARAHDGTIDLLLTDVAMPDGCGTALARQVREIRPAAVVLFISGSADCANGEMSPIDTSLLQRPFTPNGLIAKVRECLTGRSSASVDRVAVSTSTSSGEMSHR
jgi:two-component system cell cycle sensor histidine kinase/response regulator CckA